jgi:hypothetical protein
MKFPAMSRLSDIAAQAAASGIQELTVGCLSRARNRITGPALLMIRSSPGNLPANLLVKSSLNVNVGV